MTSKKKIKAEDWRDGPPGFAWDIIGAGWDEEKLVHTRFKAEDIGEIKRMEAEASRCQKAWQDIAILKKKAEALGEDYYKGDIQERTVKVLGATLGKVRANEVDILMFFYPQATEYIIKAFEKKKEGNLIYSAMESEEGEKWYYSELFPILSRYGGGWYDGEIPNINILQWEHGHIVNTPLTEEDKLLLDQYIDERIALREKIFEEVAESIRAKKRAKGETVYGLSIFQLDNVFKSLYAPKDWSSPKKIVPINKEAGQNAIVTFLATPGEDLLKKNGFTSYERWVERGVLSFVASNTKGWTRPMLWRAMVRNQEAQVPPTDEKKLKKALEKLDSKKLLIDVEQDINGKYAMLDSIDWEKEGLERPKETAKGGKRVLSMTVRELDLIQSTEMKGGHKTEVYYLTRPPFTFLCFSQPTGQYITTPDSWFHPLTDSLKKSSSEEGLLRDVAIEHILNAIDMTKNKGWRTIIRYAPILEECEIVLPPKDLKDIIFQDSDKEKLPKEPTEEEIANAKKRRETDRKLYIKWKKRLIDFLKAWGEDRYNEGMFTKKAEIGEDSIELFIDIGKAFDILPDKSMEGREDMEEKRNG